jgi:hypothetical protein
MNQTRPRRNFRIPAFSILLLCLFRLQPALAGAAMPADAVVMHPQMLFDPVLGKNAYSVLVPDQWKMQGAVTWPPGMPTAIFDLSVSNPAEHAAWREFPRLLYVAGVRENFNRNFPNQPGRAEQRFPEGTILPSGLEVRALPATPREYVEKILAPQYCLEVANATDINIVSETDLPDYAKAHTDRDPFHRQTKSTRIRMTYTTPGGPVEREFVASLCVANPGPTTMWIAEVTSCRAPKGKLDALLPTFANIESSVKVQLPWFNAECQVAEMYLKRQQEMENEILRDQAGAIAARARIFHELAQQASDQVSDHIRENFAAQQQAKSEAAAQFIHYINDTASYTDPNDGSSLTLSSSYRYQYISNHDDIIETNDPSFTPPVDPSTSWQQLEKGK